VTVNGSKALSTASAPTADLDPQDLAGRGVEQLSEVLGEQIAVTLTRQLGGALPGAGTPYPIPGGLAATDAFSPQGRSFSHTVTRHV